MIALYTRVFTTVQQQNLEIQLAKSRGFCQTQGLNLLNLLKSLADLEPELIKETDGERRQGIKIGRPRVTDRVWFNRRFGDILERLYSRSISKRQTAKELQIGHATLNRLLNAGYLTDGPH